FARRRAAFAASLNQRTRRCTTSSPWRLPGGKSADQPAMTDVFRLGLAGLGTVGSSFLRLISAHAGDIAVRAGRPVEIVALCAKDASKAAGADLSTMKWFADPVALAA